jgi:glutamate carboxypeptidase
MDSNVNRVKLMQQEQVQLVGEWFAKQQDGMVELLKKLAMIETPSDRPETQYPLIESLVSIFDDLDYRSKWLKGIKSGGHLYARPRKYRKGSPCQLLLGHCDTVWPVGKIEDMPVEINGNILRGPGVFDMKAGIVQMIFAIRALNELDINPEVTPVVFINSDEEVGSRESTRQIRRLARCMDRALIMEPSMGETGDIKTARKGVGRFVISVKGKAAHAGLDPQAGASAILELSHVIQKLFELNDYEKGITVNVGMVDGGIRPNVIAPESKAIVDVRVLHQKDADYIENKIFNLEATTPDITLEIEGGIGRPPMERTEANRILWGVMQDIAASMNIDIAENIAGGGSDGNTTSLYTATLDGMGAVGDGAHAQNEYIYLDKLVERGTLLALMLLAPPLNLNAST